MRRVFRNLVLVAIVAVIGASQAKADLITNGGFETGDFTGWSQSGNTDFTGVTATAPYVHSGTYGAFLGPEFSDGHLSQTLATTAGDSYQLTYWVHNDGGTPNDFSVSWDGTTIPGSVLVDADAFAYTEYQYTLQASTGSTVLEFSFRQDPFYYGLDDVSVNFVHAAVPEPSTLALLGLGGIGLAVSAYRRLRANVV